MLTEFGVPFELTVVSAHRTPTRMYSYAQTAAERGVQVGAEPYFSQSLSRYLSPYRSPYIVLI